MIAIPLINLASQHLKIPGGIALGTIRHRFVVSRRIDLIEGQSSPIFARKLSRARVEPEQFALLWIGGDVASCA